MSSLLFLTGCVTSEEQRAIDMQKDRDQCERLGFAAGSSAMAECMATASSARSADRDREAAANREWMRQREESARQMQARPAAQEAEKKCKTIENVSTQADGMVVTKREQVCTSF